MTWPPEGVKWYFSDDSVAIAHGDCRDIIPSLPKVDLVLTDFPYGNATDYKSYNDTQENLFELVRSVFPLIRGGADRVLLTSGVGNITLFPRPDWILSWVTPAGTGSGPWGFCCWQPILAYGKCPYLAAGLGRRHDTIIETEASPDNGHPCPKPLKVWKRIMLRGSVNTGDLILDPFAGSGTTGRAAKDLRRKAILIEIEERYCEIAAKRMSQGVLL